MPGHVHLRKDAYEALLCIRHDLGYFFACVRVGAVRAALETIGQVLLVGGMRALRSDRRQQRVLCDRKPPALAVGQMPVQHVELVHGHLVEYALDGGLAEEVPRFVYVHSAPAEAWVVLYLAAWERKAPPAERGDLPQRLERMRGARVVGAGNGYSARLGDGDAVALLRQGAVERPAEKFRRHVDGLDAPLSAGRFHRYRQRHDRQLGQFRARERHGRHDRGVVGCQAILHHMRVHDFEVPRMPDVYRHVVYAERRLVEEFALRPHLRAPVERASGRVRQDLEEPAQRLQHVGLRRGVPVAGEEDWLFVLGEGVADDRHGRLALLPAGHGQVRRRHHAVLELADQQDARLLPGERQLNHVDRLLSREHHHAVLSAPVEYGLGEGRVHPREARQLRRLVHAGDARRAPVDLLEAREVRAFRVDAGRRPSYVDPAVHPLAVAHVVGHYLELRPRRRRPHVNHREFRAGVGGGCREVASFETDVVGVSNVHAPRRKRDLRVNQVVRKALVEHRTLRIRALHFGHPARRVRRRSAARRQNLDIAEHDVAWTQPRDARHGTPDAAVRDGLYVLEEHVAQIRLAPPDRSAAPSEPNEERHHEALDPKIAERDVLKPSAVHHLYGKPGESSHCVRDPGEDGARRGARIRPRTVQSAVLYQNVADVAVAAGAELDAVAAACDAAVPDYHVCHRERLVALRLEHDCVVAGVDVAVFYEDVGGLDVDAVVGAVGVAEAREPPRDDSVAVAEVASPRAAVAVCEALEPQVAAAGEPHHDRQILRLALAGQPTTLAECPALPVQDALADDGDVGCVLGIDEIPVAALHVRVVGEVRTRVHNGSLGQLQRDVRLERKRLRHPFAAFHAHDTAALLRRRVDAALKVNGLLRGQNRHNC